MNTHIYIYFFFLPSQFVHIHTQSISLFIYTPTQQTDLLEAITNDMPFTISTTADQTRIIFNQKLKNLPILLVGFHKLMAAFILTKLVNAE